MKRIDEEETPTRNKSMRNTGNGARADRRKTEIETEPFAKQKQKAEKLLEKTEGDTNNANDTNKDNLSIRCGFVQRNSDDSYKEER